VQWRSEVSHAAHWTEQSIFIPIRWKSGKPSKEVVKKYLHASHDYVRKFCATELQKVKTKFSSTPFGAPNCPPPTRPYTSFSM
jgi:hypothetical protein